MIFPSYNKLIQIGKGYKRIPVAYKIEWEAKLDPMDCLLALRPICPDVALLESGRTGRYSYLAFNPFLRLSSKRGQILLEYMRDHTVTHVEKAKTHNPLAFLRQVMSDYSAPRLEQLPDFAGGAVGYLSYEMNQYFEPTLQKLPNDDLQLPDLYVMIYEDMIAFDQMTRECVLLTHVSSAASQEEYDVACQHLFMWERTLKERVDALQMDDLHLEQKRIPHAQLDWEELRKNPLKQTTPIAVSFEQQEFEEAVRRIQQYISAGDVFQVNLSVRQSAPLNVTAEQVYATLRKLNPSPYMGYLPFPEFQIVSGSPELLIKVQDGQVSTRPIAGTRPRGKDAAEDEALANELLANEKERAEHVMLVDLERNDMGRVCQYGSVEVSEFMVVEKYSHVMHIVSHVTGKLAEDKDAYDAVEAAFPGGTITGAPKVRTMEIIEELEKVRRGVYTGSVGWFGFNGDVEMNIAIRTMVVKDQVGHIQAGAGIVIDSKPEAEYYESLKKAEALWKAVELSEEFENERLKSREESRV
ncbi:Para-aminobenzoate synthase, aminase component [Brevibacillus laterosporus]|nr:anthranilate synthase component I family protein [Brevibacillus laterosporus]RAP19282.1 Para-aminobenzoate synthase, aminase component [Brevibacillus laterosporus]